MKKYKIIKIFKVILALSGGIDSSISLWILKKLGYKVKCVFIKCWEEENNNKYCNIKKDYKDAKNICKLFNTKLYLINLSYEYWKKVFNIFIKKLNKFKIINPDILCNKEIKFNTFLKFSIKILKADFIATGHYVIKKKKNKKFFLFKSLDKNKDQSYFLYQLKQKQIKKCIFPLGKYYKTNVRKIAKNLNLINANKKSSTGICFIGKKKYFNFIKKYIKQDYGNIITLNKKIIGQHKGLSLYTIGQRKNLNINLGQHIPYYVAKKNISKNQIIVVKGKNNINLYSSIIYINKIYYINKNIKNKKKIFCKIKIRYRQKEINCLLYIKKNIKIIFKKPVFGVEIGQSAVLYKKNMCLGGGIITKIFSTK